MIKESDKERDHVRPTADTRAKAILEALPQIVLTVAANGRVIDANASAESFFEIGKSLIVGQPLARLLPFDSPLLTLVEHARERGVPINEYEIEVGRFDAVAGHNVDAHCAPLSGGGVLIVLQERTIAEKIGRQLTHKSAARSVSGLATMLAHEIKNPLSGIRGAAQLLESGLGDADRALTQLICEETDRIVRLVDRMEIFSDQRSLRRERINIHEVLNHVERLAASGFARHIRFVKNYDPSLPALAGDRDQLIQVFLNLVKNAAEAIGDAVDGEIELATAFRPGVSLRSPGGEKSIGLPLEIRVRDTGCGIAPEIAANLFDPFVTTKASGTGLGLALVAKIVSDHGGVVECLSQERKTTFRILMPKHG